MKKILSLVLAFILAFCPIAAFSAGSPTFNAARVFKSNPPIEFILPAADTAWLSLNLQQYLDDQYTWTLDEAIVIVLREQYEKIDCQFVTDYSSKNHVAIVLTTLNYDYVNALEGEIQKNGNVVFDFNEIEPDVYIIFVLSSFD